MGYVAVFRSQHQYHHLILTRYGLNKIDFLDFLEINATSSPRHGEVGNLLLRPTVDGRAVWDAQYLLLLLDRDLSIRDRGTY